MLDLDSKILYINNKIVNFANNFEYYLFRI